MGQRKAILHESSLYGLTLRVKNRTVPYRTVPLRTDVARCRQHACEEARRPQPASLGSVSAVLRSCVLWLLAAYIADALRKSNRQASRDPCAARRPALEFATHCRSLSEALSKVSCLLTSPNTAWAELELSPRHRAPRDRGGTALLLRRPRLRRRDRHHPRPHRTFLALTSRRRRVSHHRPNYRLAPPAIAFNPPECRCPSRPPSELSLPRRGHPPEPTAAACRVGSLRGPIALSYRVVRSCRGGAVYEK